MKTAQIQPYKVAYQQSSAKRKKIRSEDDFTHIHVKIIAYANLGSLIVRIIANEYLWSALLWASPKRIIVWQTTLNLKF